VLFKGAIRSVAVRLDPAPAPERVPAGDDSDVSDADEPQNLVPAERTREVAACLRIQAGGRVGPASQDVLGRKVVAGILQLERAGHVAPIVVIGDPATRKERLGIRDRPTPPVETHAPLEASDRLAPYRLRVETGLAEPLEPFAAVTAFALCRHASKHRPVANPVKDPSFLGLRFVGCQASIS
jgi:hypothetical protein